MKKNVYSLRSKIKSATRTIFFKHLSKYQEVVWLIGSGRSGTTWVSNLINHDKSYRELFEPFHPNTIKYVQNPILHKYIRPDGSQPELLKFAIEVFKGQYINKRIDRGNKTAIYHKLLVKDISANLYACFLSRHFPNLKIIFLIRNPFAVALSKIKTKDWGWMDDPAEFLLQGELMEDYLNPFKDLIIKISKSGDLIQKQILIWCIINYVPLLQFSANELCVVFYEDILLNPKTELDRIYTFFNFTKDTEFSVSNELIKAPSKVTSKEKTKFEINSWKSEIDEIQLLKGLEILEKFGFDKLYDDHSIPHRNSLPKNGV